VGVHQEAITHIPQPLVHSHMHLASGHKSQNVTALQPSNISLLGRSTHRSEDLLSVLDFVHRCCLPRLQALLTLSHKYFALFTRATCALSVLCQYLGLGEIHLPSSGCMLKQPYSWMPGTCFNTKFLDRQFRGLSPQLCVIPDNLICQELSALTSLAPHPTGQ